jgi:hypothetical protein
MGQYKIIMATLKTLMEKQDKMLILIEKIVKSIEIFKPLIEWVRLFLIYQSFEIK